MTKLILAGAVLLGLSACDERVGRGIKAPTPKPLTIKTQQNTEKMPMRSQNEEIMVANDVPILEEELPILTPTVITEENDMPESKQVSRSTQSSGSDLDIANIRISNSPERTRLVFDSYTSGAKASVSGAYNYKYDASKKSITLTLKDYKSLSALGSSKTRTYPATSLVKKIYLSNTTQANTIKCVIVLRNNVSVKVFDIKEPGRIVIDISPR